MRHFGMKLWSKDFIKNKEFVKEAEKALKEGKFDYLELFARLEPHAFHPGKAMDLAVHYRDMLASHKVEDCLLLIKEIHTRQREIARQKKRPGQVDTQYLKLAEN